MSYGYSGPLGWLKIKTGGGGSGGAISSGATGGNFFNIGGTVFPTTGQTRWETPDHTTQYLLIGYDGANVIYHKDGTQSAAGNSHTFTGRNVKAYLWQFNSERAANTDAAFQAFVTGDSVDRIQINADGTITWGSGSATRDCRIERTGTGTLNFRAGPITNSFMLDGSGGSETNVVCGKQAALATNATDGFLHIASCAGTPTGTPTAYTGKTPVVFDSTNRIWYAYLGGAWRDLTNLPTTITYAINVERAATTDPTFQCHVTGDSVERYQVNADGTLTWGSGSATRDCRIERSGTNQLNFRAGAITNSFMLDSPGGSETNVVCGKQAALATNATDGFLHIPGGAGAPTGTPTAYTGKVPLYYDTTNNQAYVYNSNWKPLGNATSLSRDTTGGNATIPNTDTNIVTYSLGNNNFSAIMVTGNIEIVTGVTSTAQAITVKIKIGTTVKNYTINTLAAVNNHFRALALSAAQTSSATVAISHGAPAADANTTTYVYDLIVWGII